jgi:hypothetical protein
MPNIVLNQPPSKRGRITRYTLKTAGKLTTIKLRWYIKETTGIPRLLAALAISWHAGDTSVSPPVGGP